MAISLNRPARLPSRAPESPPVPRPRSRPRAAARRCVPEPRAGGQKCLLGGTRIVPRWPAEDRFRPSSGNAGSHRSHRPEGGSKHPEGRRALHQEKLTGDHRHPATLRQDLGWSDPIALPFPLMERPMSDPNAFDRVSPAEDSSWQAGWETEDNYWDENFSSRPYALGPDYYDRFRPALPLRLRVRAASRWVGAGTTPSPTCGRAGSATSTGAQRPPPGTRSRHAVRDAWDRVRRHASASAEPQPQARTGPE